MKILIEYHQQHGWLIKAIAPGRLATLEDLEHLAAICCCSPTLPNRFQLNGLNVVQAAGWPAAEKGAWP